MTAAAAKKSLLAGKRQRKEGSVSPLNCGSPAFVMPSKMKKTSVTTPPPKLCIASDQPVNMGPMQMNSSPVPVRDFTRLADVTFS